MRTDRLDPRGSSARPADPVRASPPALILARIQAHPARADRHAALADALGVPSEVVLHSSDPPSPWQGYRACLADLPQSGHILIVQDDALPCKNLAAALPLIARDVPVCLYVGGHSTRTAKAMRQTTGRYVDVWWREFLPVVAVLWPVDVARSFAEWSDDAKLPGEPNPRSDDAVAGYWMRKTRQRVLATVPSLFQHDDSIPSVKRGPKDRRPQDTVRPALMLAEDAMSYDWTCAPSSSSVYTRRA